MEIKKKKLNRKTTTNKITKWSKMSIFILIKPASDPILHIIIGHSYVTN